MKIGIYNIFTSAWFVLMLGCGITLSYVGARSLGPHVNLFALAVFVFFALLTAAILIFLVYKLRILLIYPDRVVAISPFLLKTTTIRINEIYKIVWSNFIEKGTWFKAMDITGDAQQEIRITDFEYENFDVLVKAIVQNTQYKIPDDIYRLQAKNNSGLNSFILLILFALLVFIAYSQIEDEVVNWVPGAFFVMCALLVFACAKRWFSYRKWL